MLAAGRKAELEGGKLHQAGWFELNTSAIGLHLGQLATNTLGRYLERLLFCVFLILFLCVCSNRENGIRVFAFFG